MAPQENKPGYLPEVKNQAPERWRQLFKQAIFVRHARTDWNDENRLQGISDRPLASAGILEARTFAHKLHRKEVSRIFSSDLLRAKQTAEIIREDLFLPQEAVAYMPQLRELDFGEWEGQKVADLGMPETITTLLHNPVSFSSAQGIPPNGETFVELLQRINGVSRDITDRLVEENTIGVIVSHGVVLRGMRFLGVLAELGVKTLSEKAIGDLDRNFYYTSDASEREQFIELPHDVFTISPTSFAIEELNNGF